MFLSPDTGSRRGFDINPPPEKKNKKKTADS